MTVLTGQSLLVLLSPAGDCVQWSISSTTPLVQFAELPQYKDISITELPPVPAPQGAGREVVTLQQLINRQELLHREQVQRVQCLVHPVKCQLGVSAL